jgi:UDP-N-acetylmuramate: L-alanyl-gamma-D-glutamyl-meso-diaminopimelate ligase
MSENPERVHFVAIAGSHLYPPMSTALANWGIPVHESFRPEHVLEADPELVVIGNAVRSDNPEARAALDEGFRCLSFSDALYELAIAGRHPVVVSGTHGKTTTTSLLAFLLHATGRDPSLLVGGFALDFDGSFREGQGEHFIVEGDEYDTVFFDKTPKFLHYHPRTLIITSVEFDHADIYRDLDHVKGAFRELVRGMPADGTIVAAVVHEGVRDVLQEAPCRVVGYGAGTAQTPAGRAGWRAAALEPGPDGMDFDLLRDGEFVVRARTALHGREGVENSLGALAACEALGVPLGESLAALPDFRGVKRRLEVRGEAGGVTVLDDFAHHPTAVRSAIGAARARYPGRRLVAVFEPRTNTSRRGVFQRQYTEVFDGADRVVIRAVPDAPIYSATGDVTERLDAVKLARDLSASDIPAVAKQDVEEIVAHVADRARPGDVVLVMSNGDFGGIWQKLLDAVADRPPPDRSAGDSHAS